MHQLPTVLWHICKPECQRYFLFLFFLDLLYARLKTIFLFLFFLFTSQGGYFLMVSARVEWPSKSREEESLNIFMFQLRLIWFQAPIPNYHFRLCQRSSYQIILSKIFSSVNHFLFLNASYYNTII